MVIANHGHSYGKQLGVEGLQRAVQRHTGPVPDSTWGVLYRRSFLDASLDGLSVRKAWLKAFH